MSAPENPDPVLRPSAVFTPTQPVLRFGEDGEDRLRRLVKLQSLGLLILTAALVVVVLTLGPRDRFLAVNREGKLIDIAPVDTPNLANSALLAWVGLAVQETFTFGFHDYPMRLKYARRHFTNSGWTSFTRALTASHFLDKVRSNAQIVTIVPTGAPVITDSRSAPSGFRWTVQIPVLVTAKSGSESDNNRYLITLTIVRVSTIDNPAGIGIEQWVQTAE